MKTRKITLALLLSGLAGIAGARALYRIDLRGGTTPPILTRDEPVAHGSVLLFHRHPDGRLTGVPTEAVAGITSITARSTTIRTTTLKTVQAPHLGRTVGTGAAAAPAPVRPLAPGDAVTIGPTGAGSAADAGLARANGQPAGPPSPSGDIRARAAIDAQVFPGDLPAQTGNGGATTNGTTNGTSAATAINPTLSTPANGAGSSGAAAANTAQPGAAQPIGQNGYPTTSGPGPQPGGAQPIGPNGFPTTSTGTAATNNNGTMTSNGTATNNGSGTNGTATTNQNGTQNNSNGTGATTAPSNPHSTPPANNNNGGKSNGAGGKSGGGSSGN